MREEQKGKIEQKLLHKSIFQLSVKSDPGLHHLCFTFVCDYKIFVLIDCCDYMVLDFRQQLKNALKNVEMSWGSKWGERVYTRLLLGFNIRSLKKNIILPCFHHDDHFQHLL